MQKIEDLLSQPENELLEFKEAKNNFNFDKLGRYFSALSNECKLRDKDYAYLIFGVSDKINKDKGKRDIVGTSYKNIPDGLEKLKMDIANSVNDRSILFDIKEQNIEGKRTIMFVIEKGAKNIPTTWRDVPYQRIGESLVPLEQANLRKILLQNYDWSAEIVKNATINDLNKEAIQKAREKYSERNTRDTEKIKGWSDEEFLKRTNMINVNKEITRACIILLGEPYTLSWINANHYIMWLLYDLSNKKIASEKFQAPFILAIDDIVAKIRNYKIKVLKTLFPEECDKYDIEIIREILNNCIAHQDYSLNTRITISEYDDKLEFLNAGSFLPGSLKNALDNNYSNNYHRNALLCQAMHNFKMIEQAGFGIKSIIFEKQFQRKMPLPDYDLSNNEVKTVLYGSILDENYVNILVNKSDLTLEQAILLDKIQKDKSDELTKEELTSLIKDDLIIKNGKNYIISSSVAKIANQEIEYLKNKGLENETYEILILEWLRKCDGLTAKKIFEMIEIHFSTQLNKEQKKKKLDNLLQNMRKHNKIIVEHNNRNSIWKLKR